MVKRKHVDIENLKFINEDKLPPRYVKTPWEEVFAKIPRGKAVVLEPDQVSPATVRTALKRFQKKGRFRRYYVRIRKIGERKYITYVVNPSGEETKESKQEASESLN